jgi:predicted O-linked N-acetylglucosamine transferase (SPINDLY family)
MDINRTIQLALEHYQSGNLHQAEHFCNLALTNQPNSAEVLYLLGIICCQLGKDDPAIEHIKRSLQLNPGNPDAYLALGMVMQQKGRTDDAINYFKKSVDLNPENPEACNFLANAFIEKGNDYKYKDLFDEAITCYQNAMEINSNPPHADILYHNLGMSFQAKGLIDRAIHCYQQAISINPDLIAAYNNLALMLQKKGHFDEAHACYQKALQIDPHHAGTYYNFGVLLQGQGKYQEASDVYDLALTIKPNFMNARWAKCISQLPLIYPDQSSIKVSRTRYHEELLTLRESISLETPQDIKDAAGAVGTQQPFNLAYQGLNDRKLQQLYGELVCRIMSSGYPQFSIRPVMPPHSDGAPLRVGIISGFFHYHPVWKTIIKGWIENLDKNKIHLYGYFTGRRKDKETDGARRYFVRFVEDRYSFEDLCNTIVNDNLHAIIYPEIGIDPTTLRLAALRLAPIQCAAWGHPDTSGLPSIDYYLSGDLMEPPDGKDHYTERLVRLPNLSIYYTPDEISVSKAERSNFGFRPESVLYHCCQSLFKFLPQYDDIFPRIARQVGNCRFIFSSVPEIAPAIDRFRIRINRAFGRFNLNADDYVVFLPFLDQGRYKELNSLCDVFLDPIGWSGCTSTLEAIECNLPVIALPGLLMRGRESTAILTMMGMEETIADSLDDYIALAIKLGLDIEWRRLISKEIARKKHRIYADRTCITALQAFLENMVRGETA